MNALDRLFKLKEELGINELPMVNVQMDIDYKEFERSEEDGFIEAHDENGYLVCHCRNSNMYFDTSTGNYICPQCGKSMNRNEYFHYIHAKPLDRKCYECDGDYPFCRLGCLYLEETYPEYCLNNDF